MRLIRPTSQTVNTCAIGLVSPDGGTNAPYPATNQTVDTYAVGLVLPDGGANAPYPAYKSDG